MPKKKKKDDEEAKSETEVVQTIPSNTSDLEFSGSVGGPFCIYGKGFGTVPSVVTIDDEAVTELTAWSDTFIKGVVPKHLKHGDATAEFKVGAKTLSVEGRI